METLSHEKQIQEYISTIAHLKKQNQNNPLFNSEISKLEQKLELLKEKVYSELTPGSASSFAAILHGPIVSIISRTYATASRNYTVTAVTAMIAP